MAASIAPASSPLSARAYDAAVPYDWPVPYSGSGGAMAPAAGSAATMTGATA